MSSDVEIQYFTSCLLSLSKFYKEISVMDHNQEPQIRIKYNSCNGDKKIPILAFAKAVFSTLEICGNILNIFWVGIRATRYSYKTN